MITTPLTPVHTFPILHSFRNSVLPVVKNVLADARFYQITFLSVFLSYGIAVLGWTMDAGRFLLTFATCLTTQAVFTTFGKRDYYSLLSAVISALSLCLMLKTNLAVTAALAAFLSIAEKFVLRFNGKHVFNPTNFGICMTILLTGEAWISPGQWGNQAFFLLLIGCLGLFVVIRVGRFDTALAFLLTYTGLLAARHLFYQSWPPDFLAHQLQSGTLLLFTFFMITDPVSTPSHPVARTAWAACVGALAFVLQSWYFVNGAPLWALFFLSPLTIVLDTFFKHSNFKWKQ